MTATTKKIFESFEIRKTKRQKAAFRDFIIPELQAMGYPVTVEKGRFGVRNIVIGDAENAKVLFTAHYDTCAVLPFPNFITPKCISLYLLYQLLIVVAIFAVVVFAQVLAMLIHPSFGMPAYYLSLIGVICLLLFGPANKHTANDNTSGVTAIVDLARSMPPEQRGRVAFVLFDLEEAGLIGSACFAKKHKKAMKNKLLVNLDCVSDGNTMLFAISKKAKAYTPLLKQAFSDIENMMPVFSEKHHIYPSDQMNFPCGIGVASLRKSKHGILYMNRIHTKRDVIYQEGNIVYVVEGCIRLVQEMD